MSQSLKSLCLEALHATNPESKLALLATIADKIWGVDSHPSQAPYATPPYKTILQAMSLDSGFIRPVSESSSQAESSLQLESSLQTESSLRGTLEASSLQIPSYAGFCTIAHPRKIRRPKHIKSPQALAKVLHSIVHIEYSAIDLALDALRFGGLDATFYADWLEVALQEGQHFALLLGSLHKLGFEYGDFEVHSLLFDAQRATPRLSDRMALLHRGLEANGLDSNPFVLEKIKAFDSPVRGELIDTLGVILRDEIEHVRKGDKWWRLSATAHSAQDFIALLRRYEAFRPRPRILNHEARLRAGFSQEEITLLGNL